MRNILLKSLALAALAAVIAVAGCSKKAPKKGQIGFLITLDHPYWHNMRLGAVDEGRKLGFDVTVLNAKEDPVLQIEQIKQMIAKQVDIVCLAPMKAEPLVRGVQMLNRAGIPVIIVNRQIGPGCDYVCYTGTDTYAGAVASARILMEAIGGRGPIVEFHQQLGTGPEIARSSALADVLKEYPEVENVDRIPHEGERDIVITQMQTLLQKYPDLAGVYAHGDNFAIAAAQVCRKAARGDIKVVGMGGSREAIGAVRDGLLAGTSYQQPEEEGRNAVRLAARYLAGEKLEKSYPVDCPAVTAENADMFEGQF